MPDPPPILKGKEAKAFLDDSKRPLTAEQIEVVKRALKEFPEAA